jgi:hypothetical protein
VRLDELKLYFEATAKQSDNQFMIVPGEEPNAWLGGHYNILFPRPVYWTLRRPEGMPFVEEVAGYGKVYHTGSPADVMEMLKREGGIVWQTHPRAKASTGWPDRIRETEHFKDEHFVGGGFKALPADLSHQRLGERCFDFQDDVNNWGGVKYLIGEVDTYKKYPEYDLWGDFNVNYLKIEALPAPGDFSPIVNAIRSGQFFVSTGEVLIPQWSVRRVGSNIEISAEVEWTFPLEFVEVVWGDGQNTNRAYQSPVNRPNTDRQILSTTDRPAFGKERFTFTLPAAGKKWVRFAAWDSALNGGFTQPVHLE